MSAPTKTLAFFGATGGCANTALVLALEAGHSCTALARTPAKLRDMLLANGVSSTAIDSQLRIIKGDAKDEIAVRATIAPSSFTASATVDGADTAHDYSSSNTVDTIVSGIGMDPFSSSVDGATICQVFARTLLQALDSYAPPRRPFLVAISSTGVTTTGPRDLPIVMRPIYDLLGKVMEEVVSKAERERKLRGACVVRPSLLMNWKERRPGEIRVGTEDSPAVGYFVARKDVSRWIFDECIKGNEDEWSGKRVSLTN
jgi:NAD(P)H-binding